MLADMTPRVLRATATAMLALPLALAAGCGSSSDTASDDTSASGSPSASLSTSVGPPSSPSASTSPAPAGWSACGSVWKDGAKLPGHYPGCAEAGIAVPVHRIGCSSGQTVVTYADHFFAVSGGRITRTTRMLRNSSVYASAIATCRG